MPRTLRLTAAIFLFQLHPVRLLLRKTGSARPSRVTTRTGHLPQPDNILIRSAKEDLRLFCLVQLEARGECHSFQKVS